MTDFYRETENSLQSEEADSRVLNTNVIRIMAKDNGAFQIVLSENNSATTKELAPLSSQSADESAGSKRLNINGKRKVAEVAEPLKRPGRGSAKKGKYERKNGRIGIHETGLMSWVGLKYQPNLLSLQATFAQQFADANSLLIQTLASSYTYNENVGITRARLRKEYVAQTLKKALARPPFSQNQMFHSVSYKPGTAFVQYQNYVGKGSIPMNRSLPATKALDPSKKTAGLAEVPMQVGQIPVDPLAGERFTCSGCQRTDAKKYAKNLCQTCYKKQKKLLDAKDDTHTRGLQENSISVDVQPKAPMAFPEKTDPFPMLNKEWTGTCPDCNRYENFAYIIGLT